MPCIARHGACGLHLRLVLLPFAQPLPHIGLSILHDSSRFDINLSTEERCCKSGCPRDMSFIVCVRCWTYADTGPAWAEQRARQSRGLGRLGLSDKCAGALRRAQRMACCGFGTAGMSMRRRQASGTAHPPARTRKAPCTAQLVTTPVPPPPVWVFYLVRMMQSLRPGLRAASRRMNSSCAGQAARQACTESRRPVTQSGFRAAEAHHECPLQHRGPWTLSGPS